MSSEAENGEVLLERLESFDVSGVELEYRISELKYRQLRDSLESSRLKVVSVHNYFPIPPVAADSNGSGDLFLLSSPDREERQRAVTLTTRSIEHASELGAAAVVLHCGYVEMSHEVEEMHRLFRANQISSVEAKAFIGRKLVERDRLKPPYLESLEASLEELAPVAERAGVVLGLENRFRYYQLPNFEDFETLLARFEGGPVGYWHDTGHAHADEVLGILEPQSLLETYSDKLVGIHIHDAVGLDDHLAPGEGDIDFDRILGYLQPDTLRVLELKPGTSDETVFRAVRFLRRKMRT